MMFPISIMHTKKHCYQTSYTSYLKIFFWHLLMRSHWWWHQYQFHLIISSLCIKLPNHLIFLEALRASNNSSAAARRKGRRAKRGVTDAEAKSMEANRQITYVPMLGSLLFLWARQHYTYSLHTWGPTPAHPGPGLGIIGDEWDFCRVCAS